MTELGYILEASPFSHILNMPLGVRIHVGFWSLFLAASSAETFYVHETTLTSLPLRGRIYRRAGQTATAQNLWNVYFLKFPLPSNRHYRSNVDCRDGKRENYQVCSVQYCVQQVCTVRCTHIWTALTVLYIGFCLTEPISLCLDSFLCMYCMHV